MIQFALTLSYILHLKLEISQLVYLLAQMRQDLLFCSCERCDPDLILKSTNSVHTCKKSRPKKSDLPLESQVMGVCWWNSRNLKRKINHGLINKYFFFNVQELLKSIGRVNWKIFLSFQIATVAAQLPVSKSAQICHRQKGHEWDFSISICIVIILVMFLTVAKALIIEQSQSQFSSSIILTSSWQ